MAIDPFAPVFQGRDYVMVSAMLGIIPELSTSVFAIQNMGDGSGMVVPTVTGRPLDWLDVALSHSSQPP